MDPSEGKTMGTLEPEPVSTGLRRIAKLAKEAPDMVLVTLAHHMTFELLWEANRRTRADGAPGVDGQTAQQYERDLESNLRILLERLKSGTYRAPPVRRVHIPKGDGKTRPLGIPTYEDKVAQRAALMILEAVYEQDFLSCSHGFRPGRSAHGALEQLWRGLMDMGGGYVIDADIQSFYDSMDHRQLRSFLDLRMRDGVLRRLIDKWLAAGVLEEGALQYPKTGTPQGGVISPLLANIYLHEVLDKWFEREVKPRLHGPAFLVRYADDFVIVCSREDDARKVLEVLPKRLARFGLTLHPDKTRLVPFHMPGRLQGPGQQEGPGTFDLLAFTHFWGRSQKGRWVVKRKTSKSRFTRALKRVAEWCRTNLHLPVPEQHHRLCQKLRGHYAYFGITGNSRALVRFRYEVGCTWRKWLDRRSQNARMPWARFNRLLQRYPLPPAITVHSVLRRSKAMA